MFTRPTSSIQNPTLDDPLLLERSEHRLGAANIPWRRARVTLIEIFEASVDGPARWSPALRVTHDN
jgi:hypothetical protein